MDIDLKLFSGRGGRGLNNIIPFPLPVLSGDEKVKQPSPWAQSPEFQLLSAQSEEDNKKWI